MKDVIISVTGVQQGDGEPDSLELVTAGQYGLSGEEARLSWQGSELTGMEGTRTCFSVSPRRVVMSRDGKMNTRMEFEEGKKNYFLYETPFGSATMGVETHRIHSSFGQHGGNMEIDYVVDLDQTVVGRNRFLIRVTEPEISHTGDIRWPI